MSLNHFLLEEWSNYVQKSISLLQNLQPKPVHNTRKCMAEMNFQENLPDIALNKCNIYVSSTKLA